MLKRSAEKVKFSQILSLFGRKAEILEGAIRKLIEYRIGTSRKFFKAYYFYLKIVKKIVGESKEELEFDEFFTLVTNPDYENVVELDAIFNVRKKLN